MAKRGNPRERRTPGTDGVRNAPPIPDIEGLRDWNADVLGQEYRHLGLSDEKPPLDDNNGRFFLRERIHADGCNPDKTGTDDLSGASSVTFGPTRDAWSTDPAGIRRGKSRPG